MHSMSCDSRRQRSHTQVHRGGCVKNCLHVQKEQRVIIRRWVLPTYSPVSAFALQVAKLDRSQYRTRLLSERDRFPSANRAELSHQAYYVVVQR